MTDSQTSHYSNGDVFTLDHLRHEVYFLRDHEIHISRAQENPTSFEVQGWCGITGGGLFLKEPKDGLEYGSYCQECFNY